jgi:mRNA interferase HicA
MKRNEFINYLKKNGCVFVREGNRHSWWMNPKKNLRSAVPRHSEINNILANKICKDLGINRIL